MCFLKNLPSQKIQQTLPSRPSKQEKPVVIEQTNSQSSIYVSSESLQKTGNFLDSGYFLINCLNLVNLNSQFLFNIDQKLQQADLLLEQSSQLLGEITPSEESASPKRTAPFNGNLSIKEEQHLFVTANPLTAKLFGSTQYKYKLVLNEEFPCTLYKQRNFGFSIRLVDAAGHEMNNGNIVNVCLGICTAEGEWIHETKEGLGFIKGKIDSELYHGTANFVKLAPRDVSRGYCSKTVSLVVYSQPSMLRYSGESSIEEHIDYKLIEPLIIKDVTIKAKKRE